MSEVTKIQPTMIKQFKAVETPTITSENEIFKQNNIGTIIPKDALENINLSSVPSIIQTAIDQMALSVESKVLANALLLQIQRDINNLGDAIVEKSYIDSQVSYLTSIINQKSDLGNVANIVDTRLAIVTENLATANQVSALNSRVGNSETNITNLNQTINTKDSARATQINEVQASVNQSLSNYTDAIGLTVNPDGSVSSSKIEELKAENSKVKVSINSSDQVSVNPNGSYTAYVAKFIADNNGNIVGFKFFDSDTAQKTFGINADVFKISNSTNSYTPFKIVDNELFFNGKVAFTSMFPTSEDWRGAVQNAIDNNATYIDGGKITTNQALVNNLNATGGIVADTISANELSGKTIIGSFIESGRINSSIIKTSYLDLDVNVKVLTSLHIPNNGSQNSYPCAVFISSDNEWRIPTLSVINETIMSNNIGYSGAISNSRIRSYNCGITGNDFKCVKSSPVIVVTNSTALLAISVKYSTGRDVVDGIFNATLDNNNTDTYNLYIGGTYAGSWHLHGQYIGEETTGADSTMGSYGLRLYDKNNSVVTGNYSFTCNGMSITVNYSPSTTPYKFSVSVEPQTSTISFIDANYGLFKVTNSGGNTFNTSISISATAQTSNGVAVYNLN